MSDEIKNPETELTPEDTPVSPETAEAVEAPEAPEMSEALRGELNGLRDLFQQEWNRTVAEAENEPPIQALEYEPEAEEEPEEEPQAASAAEDAPKEKKAKKEKKQKKHGKALLIVLVIVLVLVLIPLIAYFVISIKVPSFNNFISAYFNAAAAKEPAEQIQYLESALSYCDEGTVLEEFKQTIMEDIAVATCKTEGYSAAKSYVDTNFTEEMLAKPDSEEFKELLAVSSSVQAIADGAYDTVKAAWDAAEGKEIDYDAAADSLGTPALIKKDVVEALGYLGNALTEETKLAEKTELADSEKIDAMMTSFMAGVQIFKDLGADTQNLIESAAVKLYENGFIYETTVVIDNYFDEDMLAAPKTEAFTGILDRLDVISKLDTDVYAVAAGLYENKTVSADKIKNALDLSLSDTEANVIVKAAQDIIEGLKLEADKDLTNAASSFTKALNTLSTLKMDVAGLCGKLIVIHLQLGDAQSALSVRENYLPGEIDTEDEELNAAVTEIDKIGAALSAAEEVFYPHYYGYYYGTAIDKDKLNSELDALLENDPDDYLTAYVNFFKFYGESMTTADDAVMEEYLTEFSKVFADYPAFYASQLGEIYRIRGDYEKAEALADEVLAFNATDDYANAVKSLAKRISLNLDDALEIAKTGFERSGAMDYCAREYVICALLKEDYETAFDVASQLYDTWLTYDNLEYIMIITSFFESEDAELQAKLDAYREQAEQALDEAGVTIRETAQKLIDGKMTMVQVFMEEPYYLK